MRLLWICLVIVHVTEVRCQDENFSDIFDVAPRKKNVVGASDFIGHAEEVNEGSDSFATSTEVVEPITEPTVTTMRHEVQTVEPLELTTTADRNATPQVPNVPAVNADDTHPLPDEVLVADPFSIDEISDSERAVDVPAVALVVPVVHADNRSPPQAAEPKDDFSPSPTEAEEMTPPATSFKVPVFPSTLERRILKEKEEAMAPTVDPTSDVHFEAETTENFPLTTEFLLEETTVETSQVTEGSQKAVPERSEFEDVTLPSEPSSSDSTTSSEGPASESFRFATATTPQLPVNEEPAFTRTNPAIFISTTTARASTMDEDAPPFDQEKLSRLFEQDGSFIPDHLINQPSSEPMFPRVEMPEESTEILNEQHQKKITTTTEPLPFSVPGDEKGESTTTIGPETPSTTRHPLQQNVIQPFSLRTDNNEMSHIVGTLSPHSKESNLLVSTFKPADESSQNEQKISTTVFSTTSAEPQTELSQESRPALVPTPEETLTVTAEKSELAPQPELESVAEARQSPEPQPHPEPEPEPQPVRVPAPKPEPDAEPQPEPKLKSQAVPEPAAPTPEPVPQTPPQSKLEPQSIPDPAASKPDLEPQPRPEPRLEPQFVPEPAVPKPKPEPEAQPEPNLDPQAVSEPAAPKPEPEPERHLHARPWQPVPNSRPESELSSEDLVKTMLTMRMTSVEFTDEFTDKSNGQYKKLNDQIVTHVSNMLKPILGENFVGYEIASFTKGSVIVNGIIFTRDDIHDAEELATKIETMLSSNGSLIGPNEVDLRSIAVNGIPSRAYVEHVHSSYPQNSTSSALVIGSMIAVGVVVVLVVAFVAIAINNRRTNGTMKLKDDDMPRIENGKAAYSNPQPVSVNLTSYGNGTTTTPTNGPSMVTVSSPCPATVPSSHF